MIIEFTVHGNAAPAGSKRGFVKGGRVIITDASKGSRSWKTEVKDKAVEAMSDAAPLEGALAVEFTFFVMRPKGHFGTGRNATVLKPSAPEFPTVKPDLLKLARAIEDAMSGVVYRDDAQIVTETLRKRYTDKGARVDVVVRHENPIEAAIVLAGSHLARQVIG